MMKIVDLTHTIAENMPVYPGTEGPKLTTANTYETDGFKETLLKMYSHTGTHMDPLAHLQSWKDIGSLSCVSFWGELLRWTVQRFAGGDRITMDMIDMQTASSADYLLFNTGWSKYWGKKEYFGKYPCVTDEVIDYIKESGKKRV